MDPPFFPRDVEKGRERGLHVSGTGRNTALGELATRQENCVVHDFKRSHLLLYKQRPELHFRLFQDCCSRVRNPSKYMDCCILAIAAGFLMLHSQARQTRRPTTLYSQMNRRYSYCIFVYACYAD